mgnify:CR=1 FL=1
MIPFLDAIRKGSMFRPQAFGWFFNHNKTFLGSYVLGSCVMGAALEANIGYLDDDINFNHLGNLTLSELSKYYPFLNKSAPDHFVKSLQCGACNDLSIRSIANMLACMNDHQRLSREDIADKLEPFIEEIEALAT